jgi:hypothetical protein
MIAPVVYDASGDNNHMIGRGDFVGRAGALIGCRRAESMCPVGLTATRMNSVSMMPGRTTLARMPSAATSRANPIVNESTAPLLAA